MDEWKDFFVATTGAAAALTGLIFVGISINLKEILEHKSLPTRASLALILLVSILISSIILLTPLKTQHAGITILVIGAALWMVTTIKDVNLYGSTLQQYKNIFLINILIDQFAVIPYLIAGILLIMDNQLGFYFILTAYVISLCKAVSDAWVLIIEILR